MKYARIELERRFLVVGETPDGEVRRIEDRYIDGTRFRLRKVSSQEGVVLKLGRQEDLEPGTKQVTTIYLSEQEFAIFAALPARAAEKMRTAVGSGWVIDTYPDGTRIAETEDEVGELPAWVGEEITGDEGWSGFALAGRAL